MSLFRVCNWWSVQSSDLEANYDSQLLHCCRFGSNEQAKDYVIVASHSGYLSVFQPNTPQNDVIINTPGYKPTDQLLEIQLPYPIIQLSSGGFITGSNKRSERQLVILHPFKLTVYEFHSTSGLTDHGIQYKLNSCFEHKFPKAAYSLCHGHFGGHKSCEYFCVMHMDASLTFFEQDGISYETTLDGDRNLPSKMVYNNRLDTFLVNSPHLDLECYRYQDIGQTLDVQTQSVIYPIWRVCIGEYPLDMQIQQITQNESIILVLCENSLYGISDTSNVKFIKRLDYSPICLCTFVAGWYYETNARLIVTIISDNGTVLIYDKTTLTWAAQLTDVPVSIVRSNLSGLPGAICTLSENGKIDISYLGSDPQTFQVPPLNLQKLNFEKTQNELIDLEKEITAAIHTNDLLTFNPSTKNDLTAQILFNEPKQLQNETKLPLPTSCLDHILMVPAQVILSAHAPIKHIQAEIICPPSLKVNRAIYSINQMCVEQSNVFDIQLYVESDFEVCGTAITVIISYFREQNIPSVIEKTEMLPLSIFYRLCTPKKTADIHITISTDQVTAPRLGQLFANDFQLDASQNVLAFQSIYTGRIVTFIMAKNSNRYRVQSDHFTEMSSMIQSLVYRLDLYLTPSVAKIITIPPLPLAPIIALMEDHFSAYQHLRESRERMKECSIRLRLLERRYFTKLDDKKSDSIESILIILRTTQHTIVKEIQALEHAKRILIHKQNELSCGLNAMCHLVRMRDNPMEVSDELNAILSSTILIHSHQCWEEAVASGLYYINYVGALRKQKNVNIDDVNTVGVTPFEFIRFKRHFYGVLERASYITIGDEMSDVKTDDFQKHQSLEEEEEGDVMEGDTQIKNGSCTKTGFDNKHEEKATSEWVYDVEKMVNILPKLADINVETASHK